ncbi:MAG: DMT family transporter [Gammaproteobacteria bacterium]|nr:DMT family transporter [Gammaproteobacteria bacterium]
MLKLIIGAIMISFAPVFVKLVSVSPTTSAFYRMLFGGLILAIIVLQRRDSLRLNSKVLWGVSLAAFFFTLDLIVWHRSIVYVGPGLSTLLANFQVFILAFFGVLFLKEKVSWQFLISVPLALLGLGLIVFPEWGKLGAQYQLGIIFGLLTAVVYAAYIISLRSTRVSETAVSPYVNLAVISFLTAAMLAVALLIEKQSFAIPTLKDGALLAAYALIAQVVGWILISKGLESVRASLVGLILLLQPTFAYVWDILFFDRALSVLETSGALIALVAIYLGSVKPEGKGDTVNK